MKLAVKFEVDQENVNRKQLLYVSFGEVIYEKTHISESEVQRFLRTVSLRHMEAYLMVKEINRYFQINKILLMSVRLRKRKERSPTKGPADDLENIRRPSSGYFLPQSTILYTTLLSFVMTPRN